MMTKTCLALAIFWLFVAAPLRAFDWETANSNGREYVSLHSFCQFYGFAYAAPAGNERFTSRNGAHAVSLKLGSSDAYIDGVHYVLSFPVEGGDRGWLISRMDTIKLFEPVLRPTEISGRHPIRGVVIDAGHGGSDNGATSRFGSEKNYTIDTAQRLDAILRSAGLKTVFTRRSDVFVDLYERAHIASLYPDYCFVSLHYNSASEEASGLETYCLSPRGAASTSSRYLTRGDIQKLPGNDDDPANILLASMVHSEIIKLNPGDSSADRGVKRARFVVIKMNQLPAILVEGGFVSNRMEAARVNRPDYRQNLAQSIARGVIKFVNVMGNRHVSLSNDSPAAPPPRAMPVASPAPAGLARDVDSSGKNSAKTSAKKKISPAPPAIASTPATATARKNKKSKNHPVAAAPSLRTTAPELSPTPPPPPESHATESSKGGTPALNLAEPAAPTPSPEADKAPPEPDEPPTGNNGSSVSTTPPVKAAESSTNAPAAGSKP